MRQTRKRQNPMKEMQITEEAMASLRERVEAMQKTLEWNQKQIKMLNNSKMRAFFIRGVHESQHQQMKCHPGKTNTVI